MTRAIDRLVVCGAEGERGRPDGLLVGSGRHGALQPVSVKEPADGDGEGACGAIARRRRHGAPIASAAHSGNARRDELPRLARARRAGRGGVGAAAVALARLRRRNGARARRQTSAAGPNARRRWRAA